ncbi:branched-chain amino acid aminotransferase [Pleomassaria siparia CBS 279.74]|uniref:Branched-chain amino acid aminotransferase n=1 Tax=Pleomassaria siparia CBS 279.74 TaxID=1314801 RepID=A0A6G1JQK6_9PLEO|nr:branched-chain amino acid aminotransferase [Pleomassaria siparia CBS 279.74]
MAFPPPPTDKISDWANLSLAANHEVNGHVEVLYRGGSSSSWGKPRFVKDPYLRIHGLSPSLNYGQQAYEGMKAYRDVEGQVRLFRPRDHAARLARSAAFVSIPSLPEDAFIHSVHLAVSHNAEFVPPHNSGAAMYIRPILIGLSPQLAPIPPSDFLFCIYVQPLSPYLGRTALDAVVLDDFDRAAPRGVGSAKVGGNYAPVMRWSAATKAEGFGLILHLDSETHTKVEEFSTSGFLGIVERNRQVSLVVSNSTNIITSITTDSVTQIAASLGWNVERREQLINHHRRQLVRGKRSHQSV